jgi:hypothetical protein
MTTIVKKDTKLAVSLTLIVAAVVAVAYGVLIALGR